MSFQLSSPLEKAYKNNGSKDKGNSQKLDQLPWSQSLWNPDVVFHLLLDIQQTLIFKTGQICSTNHMVEHQRN